MITRGEEFKKLQKMLKECEEIKSRGGGIINALKLEHRRLSFETEWSNAREQGSKPKIDTSAFD